MSDALCFGIVFALNSKTILVFAENQMMPGDARSQFRCHGDFYPFIGRGLRQD